MVLPRANELMDMIRIFSIPCVKHLFKKSEFTNMT